jgi:abortive infection bacteriophage resistance protein
MESLTAEINRSTETFIGHYKTKYSSPTEPPSWMSLEVSSFSLLSRIFQNLKKGPEKKAVTSHFGLNDVTLLENWMLCFSHVRNICAHHSRFWNRRLTAHVYFPTNPQYRFIRNTQILPYKLYAVLSCMHYMLQRMGVSYDFKDNLKALIPLCPLRQEKEMGFPKDWRTDPFWS